MNDTMAAAITRSPNRKLLYHFTRASNLPAIAYADALLASARFSPSAAGERRLRPVAAKLEQYPVTLNAHLRIADSMIDASTTQEQFRAALDRHVFLWPTRPYCQKMIDTYTRREPDERFAILELDASSLLADHYSAVKLSKYDSGSSPRFPALCSYKKSPAMFVPLGLFGTAVNATVPVKPSDIREVLVEDRVAGISRYLRSVYVDRCEDAPEKWRCLARPLAPWRSSSPR
ncbi:DUF7002 family protein [Paenibacillus hodogayensis]|uniref:DUF7002 family protein n=1 Tax=Paenibacillus hodogayensis TaxID=279208 RepID=A0ABV5VWN0_9BACL